MHFLGILFLLVSFLISPFTGALASVTHPTLHIPSTQEHKSSKQQIPPDNPITRLQVSDNGRFLTTSDNKPFFWLGDTAWELAHRLDRSEVLAYLKNCAQQGINVVQFVALAELDGLTAPNAYGDLPLIGKNPEQPDVTPGSNPIKSSEYDYWDHIDYIIETAESHGIYIALLPTWGSYLWQNHGQKADPIFNVDNAYLYGKWLGERYGHADNLIWILGGDRIPDTPDKLTLIRNMANGLNDGGGTQLKTYHPWGGKSSSEYFHHDEWLDFNSYQSGHQAKDYANDRHAQTDYAKNPAKPTIDLEPRYEHLPIRFNLGNGTFDGYDTRQAAYWSVFAGAFGHTYGHNSIWQMHKTGKPSAIHASTAWTQALHADGRTTLKWLKALIESRPMLERIPDSSLVTRTNADSSRIVSTRGEDYAFVYSSEGTPFDVSLGILSGDTVTAYWYNPRSGAASRIADYPNSGNRSFSPPSSGRGNDWVLVLDDKSKGYRKPGME